jgi:broad specificity phosphatase PhoE
MAINYIYIRHAPKEYSNGHAPPGRPQHDPSISKRSFQDCEELGNILIENYGLPSMIITSPYLRTRQTAAKLSCAIPESMKCDDKNLFIDTNIAEYLGNQRGQVDVNDDTFYYSLKPTTDGEEEFPLRTGETKPELNERILNHLQMMQILHKEGKENNRVIPETYKIIWIITHGLVISTIYDILRKSNFSGCSKDEFYPAELSGIAITIKEDSTSVSLLYPLVSKKDSYFRLPMYEYEI